MIPLDHLPAQTAGVLGTNISCQIMCIKCQSLTLIKVHNSHNELGCDGTQYAFHKQKQASGWGGGQCSGEKRSSVRTGVLDLCLPSSYEDHMHSI